MRCLELKRTKHRFYVCPLIKKKELIGFVQLCISSNQKDEVYMHKETKETAFVVKTVDERN